MATHKQAIKRHKQSLVRSERNHYFKATMRSYLKQARLDLEEGDKTKADDSVRKVSAYLDHVATRGVIHRNRAARLKSRLNRQLAAL